MDNIFNLNVDIPNLELFKQKANELSQLVEKVKIAVDELQKFNLEVEIK